MEIVTNELRIGEGLGHQHGGPAVAAPDISDFGAALQLVYDPVERGEPIAHQIVVVAGAEKTCYRAEEAARVIAPRHAPAGRKHRLNLILALGHPRHQVKGS